MIEFILAAVVILWFLGYVDIPWLRIPEFPLFVINGRTITFFDAVIVLLAIWIIDLLPSPFREITLVLALLYVLALLGIIAIAGFSNIALIVLVLGVLMYLVQRK